MCSLFSNRNVLFLSPHTDDVELSCGATLSRCVAEAKSVHVVVFSAAVASLPANSSIDRLKNEFLASMESYNIPQSNLHIYDYDVRMFNFHRQEILDDLILIRNDIMPDIVFTPSRNDVHQDHQVIHKESVRAFKSSSIFGYELPWNHFTFDPHVLVNVSDENMQDKLTALGYYGSQVEKNRPYFDQDVILSLARARGIQYNVRYAEAFELITLKI